MKRKLWLFVLASLLPQLASEAFADCAARFDGPSRIILSDYDPFAPTDMSSPRSLTVKNTGDQTCKYRVVFARTPGEGRLGPDIRYSLTNATGADLFQTDNPPFDATKSLATEGIAPQNAGSVTYSVFLPRGQFARPGVYVDSISAVLLVDGSSAELDRRSIRLLLRVKAIATINIAGGGLATSVNFGSLEAGKTRSVILQTRSNERYTIRLTSQHRGRLRLDPPITGQDWSVDYRMEIDGTGTDLSTDAAIFQGESSESGERTHTFAFKLLDATNKRAGLYKDVITATICPNH